MKKLLQANERPTHPQKEFAAKPEPEKLGKILKTPGGVWRTPSIKENEAGRMAVGIIASLFVILFAVLA